MWVWWRCWTWLFVGEGFCDACWWSLLNAVVFGGVSDCGEGRALCLWDGTDVQDEKAVKYHD